MKQIIRPEGRALYDTVQLEIFFGVMLSIRPSGKNLNCWIIQNDITTFCDISALFILIGASIFTGEYKSEISLNHLAPSGSLYLCYICVVLYIIAGIMILAYTKTGN